MSPSLGILLRLLAQVALLCQLVLHNLALRLRFEHGAHRCRQGGIIVALRLWPQPTFKITS